MHVMSKLGLALVFLAGFAAQAMATPVIYTCSNASDRQFSILQQQIVISHDEATQQVFVSDPMILSVVGKPLAGKVNSDNAKRIVFSWTVKNVVNADNKTATLLFKGTYFKRGGKFLISARPLGYDNTFEDQGTCTRQ